MATVKLETNSCPSVWPARSFAPVETRIDTRSPGVSGAAGANVRTSLSIRSVPLTGVPPDVSSRNAPSSVARSIGAEKRTSTATPGSTSCAPSAGNACSTSGDSERRNTRIASTAPPPSGSVRRATTGVIPPASVEKTTSASNVFAAPSTVAAMPLTSTTVPSAAFENVP